ncbi:AAA family ATPase [Sphingobacterium hungaricum]|uniref:ATPase n=1 Tax=Sphingobacterium hungaricum TaxID=2082723 RepID=A0A928YP97_9SPHI|nr:AAA family ATPase [Sphingobacterium hungaricum]MBE8712886.1 ATPase [Sphingobacterium hungaricum]
MITEVGIVGYKSIKRQLVKLTPLNVLIGGNGVGKSNFISIFSLIKNLYEGNLQNYIATKGGANSFLHFGSKLTKEISIGLTFDDVNRFFFDLQYAQDKLIIKNLSTSFFNKIWHDKLYQSNVLETDFSSVYRSQAYWVNPYLIGFDVYHFHDTSDNSPMKMKCNINDNIKLRRDGSNLAAFLYFLKEIHPLSFKKIEMTITSVAPFFESFVLIPDRLNSEMIQLEWREKGNTDAYFNAFSLSDGSLRFICLVTLLLQPNPPKTIIIDEPELGLHPYAINKIVNLMKKLSENNYQIIVSTQSVTLLDNFDSDSILVADREDGQTVFKRLNKDDLSNWINDYSLGEMWEKNLIGGLPF